MAHHARGRHRARHVAHIRSPGGPHRASRRRASLTLMRALRRAAAGGAARGGSLLLQALPAGRLARAGKRPPSLPAAQPRRGLRVVRRVDAHRPASGGTILLQAVPAGVLPTRPQGSPQLPEDPGLARHVAPSGRQGAGIAADAVGARGRGRRDQSADQRPLAMGRGNRGQRRHRLLLPDLRRRRMAARERAGSSATGARQDVVGPAARMTTRPRSSCASSSRCRRSTSHRSRHRRPRATRRLAACTS
jgi:hypothetical protein